MRQSGGGVLVVLPLVLAVACTSGRGRVADGRHGFVVKAGVVERNTDGEEEFRETSTIPVNSFRPSVWCFVVGPPNDDPYDVYSVVYPPAQPARLTGEFADDRPSTAPTAGLRTQPKEVDGVRPFCFELDPDDPLGEYRVEVFVDEQLRQTLRLQVVAPRDAR